MTIAKLLVSAVLIAGVIMIPLMPGVLAANSPASEDAGPKGHGEPSDGAGPGLQNQWGVDVGGHGQPSDGAGPGLNNQWGVGAGGNGPGYGEPSDGAGPDLQNQWKGYQD